MKLPYLLLLPLLAVLLFGNCNGGVAGFLTDMGPNQRTRLKALVIMRRQQRAAARQQLHGRARQEAYQRIEQSIDISIDSLVQGGWETRKKLRNRRSKIERQVLRMPPEKPAETKHWSY